MLFWCSKQYKIHSITCLSLCSTLVCYYNLQYTSALCKHHIAHNTDYSIFVIRLSQAEKHLGGEKSPFLMDLYNFVFKKLAKASHSRVTRAVLATVFHQVLENNSSVLYTSSPSSSSDSSCCSSRAMTLSTV